MNLPPQIHAYFDADRRADEAALIQAFAADAVVVDDGHTHIGRAAIGAWWRGSQAKYQPAVELVDARLDGDADVVRGRVSGNFPGSPVVLTFSFRLADDGI